MGYMGYMGNTGPEVEIIHEKLPSRRVENPPVEIIHENCHF